MKRTIAVLMLLCLVMALFTGCLGNGEDARPDPATPESTQTVPQPGDASGAPLLWKVTDDAGHTLYLFGTIHAGDERIDAVLNGLKNTIDSCDALAVEFDVVAFETDLAAIQAAAGYMIYADGTKLKDHVSEAQHDAMIALTQRAGLYNPLMEMYNLATWYSLCEQAMIALSTKLQTEKAMDSLLIRYANERGKTVLEVESSEFQYSLLAAFPEELYLLMLDELLEMDEKEYGDLLNRLYEAWYNGDETALTELLETESDESLTPEQQAMVDDYHRKMMDDRNLGMRDKAIAYLQSGQTVFFAVGTAHMLGDTGLIRLLTDAGCTVVPVER